jgi:hypothetical protein
LLYQHYTKNYQPVLIEGNDGSGIDVGFLIKSSYRIKRQQSLFRDRIIGMHNEKLFSRPPLLVEICSDQCVTVMNLHLRSMRGLHSSRKSARVALKRQQQAETIANWTDNFQKSHPKQSLIILGDMNALPQSDAYVDSIGILTGNPNQHRPKWKSADLIDRDLYDATLQIPRFKRYSYLYKGQKQQLDYLLTSSNISHQVESIAFRRIDFSLTDHAALVADIDGL